MEKNTIRKKIIFKRKYSEAICLTCGEQSENHVGMQKQGNGLSKSGFTIQELLDAKINFEKIGCKCEYYRLDNMSGLEEEEFEKAGLLIIRNAISKITPKNAHQMYLENINYKWDTKYWDVRRSKVLNKRARHNVCFGKTSQEPDFENKKGTIISYDKVPITTLWRNSLSKFIGKNAEQLEIEGNRYYNIKKCGIGFHGDAERKKVIAVSLGASRPIHWQWYHKFKPIGQRLKFELHNGDMYIMSEKTTGYDWKKSSLKTLRHAAGIKYVGH